MRIELLNDEQQVAPWLADWNTLSDNAPFRTPLWCLDAFKTFRHELCSLQVVACIDAFNRCLGVLPLLWEPRTKTLICDGALPQEIPLAASAFQCPAIEGLDWSSIAKFLLTSTLLPPWRTLRFVGVRPSDTSMQTLRFHWTELGAPVRETNPRRFSILRSNSPSDLIADSRKQPRQSPKEWRESLATWTRIKEQWAIRERWIFDVADWSDFLPVLIGLHQRWSQHSGRSGQFSDPRLESFLNLIATNASAENRLLALQLSRQGMPCAAVLGWRTSDTWFPFLAGFESGETVESSLPLPTSSLHGLPPRETPVANSLIVPKKITFDVQAFTKLHIRHCMPRFGLKVSEILYDPKPWPDANTDQVESPPPAAANPIAELSEESLPVSDWIFGRVGLRGTTQQWWDAGVTKIKSSLDRWTR